MCFHEVFPLVGIHDKNGQDYLSLQYTVITCLFLFVRNQYNWLQFHHGIVSRPGHAQTLEGSYQVRAHCALDRTRSRRIRHLQIASVNWKYVLLWSLWEAIFLEHNSRSISCAMIFSRSTWFLCFLVKSVMFTFSNFSFKCCFCVIMFHILFCFQYKNCM